MHWMTVGIITLGLTTTLATDESPLVEKYRRGLCGVV